MSNILLKKSLGYSLQRKSRRYFSLNRQQPQQQHEQVQEQEEPSLKHKRIEDIVADFEKPLIDPQGIQDEDPGKILVASFEKYRPKKKRTLTTKEMEKLCSQLGNSFNVSQLVTFTVGNNIKQSKKMKKKQLINTVVERIWGIQTREQIIKEERRQQKDIVKQSFPALRHELFFIIGNNGNTLKRIEKANNVKITIDVSSDKYIVEGPSALVIKAKQEIKTHLNIQKDEMDLPKQVVENQELKSEISSALIDVSKVAGTFITLEDNDKFSLASLSNDSMDNAKRLLNLMLMNVCEKKPIKTIINNNTEFTVLPFHDSNSMSLYNRRLNWNRLECNNKHGHESTFKLLKDGKEIGTMNNIKDILLEPFGGNDNISMEARFGHVLFQNATSSNNVDILNLYKNRSIFFNTMPPCQLTKPFNHLISNGGFHQRSIQLDYIGNNEKLNIEFNVNEKGDISLKNIIGIKNQSVIDILGVCGNIDIRLLANQFIDYSNKQDLKDLIMDQCKLTSYYELNAPKQFNGMILDDVTFVNKKKFLVDKIGLVCINHIEQQDKRAKRTELTVNSVENETLNITNSINRWPLFSNILIDIANRWVY